MGLRPLKQEIVTLTERPVTVISTHCHFDHIGGAHEFVCRLGHRLEASVHAESTLENSATIGFVRAETFKALPYEVLSPRIIA
jgi:glyoxylase-like metal-dependent hydrolase (beta-lactamase superfamily II)